MISDRDRLSIVVSVDDSVVKSDISISLGLIVTELVINALKHAFPQDRSGKISVDYRAQGQDWNLSVRDDGIGMGDSAAKAGLGTGIVEALARNLQSDISVTDANPGTLVTVTHLAHGIADVPAAA
jgi:two-component sensor histidine kinase